MAFTLLSQKLLKHKSLPLFCSFLLHYAKTVNFSFTLALSKVHPPLATSDQRDSSKDACVLDELCPIADTAGLKVKLKMKGFF